MKTLETLLRVHRWQLDAHRRALKELDEMKIEVKNRITKLDEELSSESENARHDVVRFSFPSFLQNTMRRKRNLKSSLNDIEEKIVAVREQLTESYRETKKYERLLEDWRMRNKIQKEYNATQLQDEMTLVRYTRQKLR